PLAWDEHPDLAHALTLLSAESEFLEGRPEQALERAELVATRARTNLDRAAAYRLKQEVHIARGQFPESANTGLACLAVLGIHLPAHPTWAEVLEERDRVERLLGDRSVESLVDLAPMRDPERMAALQVLASSHWTDVNLFCAQIARMVALSLEHGHADASV